MAEKSVSPNFKRSLILHILLVFSFTVCAVGMVGTAFADLYYHKGVVYDPGYPRVPYTQPGDLGVPPLGVNTFLNLEDPANIDRILDMVKAGGFGFIRQLFPWKDIEFQRGSYLNKEGQDGWARYDAIVEKAQARGIQIIARLDQPPVWSREKALQSIPPQLDVTGPPDDLNDWGIFVQAAVTRYKGKVKYFQIWNEPNLEYEWNARKVDPAGYVALLKVAYERAKAANPEAVIISAALAPTNQDGPQFNSLNDLKYLDQFYAAGGARYMDVMAAQAYGLGYSPEFRFTEPDFREKDLKRVNFSRLADMRQVMEKYGDQARPVWITEYGWLSMTPAESVNYNFFPWGDPVDEATQARYLTEGLERARREWPWLGVANVWFFKSDKFLLERNDVWGQARHFALVNPDWSPRPAYTALQTYSAERYKVAKSGYHSTNSPALTLEGNTYKFRFEGQRLDIADLKGVGESEWRFKIDGAEKTVNLKAGIARQPLVEALNDGPHLLEYSLPSGVQDYGLYVSRSNAFGWLFIFSYVAFGAGLAGSGGLLGLRLFRGLEWVWPRLVPFTGKSLRWSWQNRQRVAPYGIALGLLLYYFAPPTPLAIAGAVLLLPLAFIRPDWMIFMAVFTAPLFLNPRNLRENLDPFTKIKNLVIPRDPNNLPKNPLEFSLFEVIIVTAAVAWGLQIAFNLWKNRRAARQQAPVLLRKWLTAPFSVPLIVFFLAATLSLLSPDPSHLREALREYRVVVVEPFILYLLVVRFIRRGEQAVRIFDVLAIGGVLIAAGGFYQFLFTKDNTVSVEGVSRVISVYSHPDNLGLYIGRIIPLVTAVAFFSGEIQGKEWFRRRWLYRLALLPLAGALVLSFSRGAWLATALAIMVIIIVARSRKGLIIFGVGALALLAALPFVRLERITSLFNFVSGSNNTRLNVWQASLEMIRDHPVTGIGLDQFLYKYQLEYVKPEAWLERFTSHPHNLILDFWLRLGIIGPIVIIWLLAIFFRTALSGLMLKSVTPEGLVRKTLALGLIGSMVDFAAHGLVDNSYFVVDLAAIFLLSCGLIEILRREAINEKLVKPGVSP
jgi:O-antigen ligase